MAPTTPGPGAPDPLVPRLDERVADAFAEYAGAVDRAFPAAPGRTGVAGAYGPYAAEVARVLPATGGNNKAWELSVDWYRALQGATAADPLARYNDLVAAAVDVGVGQQKVLEAYQALVAAALAATEGGDPAVVDGAFATYVTAVRRAWADTEPAALTPGVVLAASQGVLAATSLHGLLLQSLRRPAPVPAARRDPAG